MKKVNVTIEAMNVIVNCQLMKEKIHKDYDKFKDFKKLSQLNVDQLRELQDELIIEYNKTFIPAENKLKDILDFDVCKKLVADAIEKGETCAILCPHYSINVQSKYEDGEQLIWDLDELSNYIGEFVEVNDYDDLVVNFADIE